MSLGGDHAFRGTVPALLLVTTVHAAAGYALSQVFGAERGPEPLPAVKVALIAHPLVQAPRAPLVRARQRTALPKETKAEPAPPVHEQISAEPGDIPPPVPAAPPPVQTASHAPPQPVVEPVYRMASLNNPPPDYPSAARRRGQEGTVVLSAEVLNSGLCGDVVIKRGSGYALLDQAALAAVKRWRFLPARRGHEPVVAWVEVPITFRLDHYAAHRP